MIAPRMRLWLSRHSEAPLREQLATQIILGIASNDLKPGQKLPSTRELALRFHIHPNTVSAAYRDLAKRNWVEFRKGSGVYVRRFKQMPVVDPDIELDRLVSGLFDAARKRGYALREVRMCLERWLTLQPPDHFLVIEPDPELREILVAEVRDATDFDAKGIGLEGCADPSVLAGAAPAALSARADQVRSALPPQCQCMFLNVTSVTASMQGATLPPPDALVTVVSRWPDFLKSANHVLIAAGINADALDVRDARLPGWQKGLTLSDLVIADSLTATKLPHQCNARIFRVIADSSRAELISFTQYCTSALA